MPSSADLSPPPAGLDQQGRDLWRKLDSRFPKTFESFGEAYALAQEVLSEAQLRDWVDCAQQLGERGLGAQPQVSFLMGWPTVVVLGVAEVLDPLKKTIDEIWQTPNKAAIDELIQALPRVCDAIADFDAPERRERVEAWLEQCSWLSEATSVSIHGHHQTHPSAALIPFIGQSPRIIRVLEPDGVARWLKNGVRIFSSRPDRLADYCALESAEAIAFLAHSRKGGSLEACRKVLTLSLKALGDEDPDIFAIPTHHLDRFQSHLARPYMAEDGFRLADILQVHNGVSPTRQYLISLLHMAWHRRLSQRITADNLSPLQRLAIEVFEDTRIDCALMERFPGLAPVILSLHPIPDEKPLATRTDHAFLRLRLAIVSRAVLDPNYEVHTDYIVTARDALLAAMRTDDCTTETIASIALRFIAKTRTQQDQLSTVWFDGTRVSYRDDNRHLWRFIEAGDEEDTFEPDTQNPPSKEEDLPPVMYSEWDYQSQAYRPSWVSLYERLQPTGDAQVINQKLTSNAGLLKTLTKIFEKLRPHDRVRERFIEHGDQLDLDVALDAWVELKSGVTPRTRIDESVTHNHRKIAIYLLVDLSESLNDTLPGGQKMLDTCRDTLSLLSWSMNILGDQFAIGGFSSDTRHRVHFQHIKGFSEAMDDTVKGRIESLRAQYSTRMGVALRHASKQLAAQQAQRKLLLVITDGEPSDIDVSDPRYLIEDARHAVSEAVDIGVLPYCISVDANADEYIQRVFGQRISIVDRVEKLPEKATEIFLQLTR